MQWFSISRITGNESGSAWRKLLIVRMTSEKGRLLLLLDLFSLLSEKEDTPKRTIGLPPLGPSHTSSSMALAPRYNAKVYDCKSVLELSPFVVVRRK